jgi:hypothetical protein
VIARAVTLAVRTNAPDTKNVDAALSDAINRWRTLDLPLFWEAVVAYCNAIKANFAEQVMLLTYLQTILPPEPPATTSGAGMDPAYAADLICALNEVVAKALATGNPNDIYATCGLQQAHRIEHQPLVKLQPRLLVHLRRSPTSHASRGRPRAAGAPLCRASYQAPRA